MADKPLWLHLHPLRHVLPAMDLRTDDHRHYTRDLPLHPMLL